jgi:hypothetical protein
MMLRGYQESAQALAGSDDSAVLHSQAAGLY